MNMRHFFWGFLSCVAISFLLAVGVALGGGGEGTTAGISEEAYVALMENEVLDLQDLTEGAEIQRRVFNRITPSGVSLFQPMMPSLAPFDSKYFDESFLDGLLGEDKNSVAVYPLSLVLDPKTRKTLVYNADGELIASAPSDEVSRAWSEDADPARVILRLDLLPAEDVEQYLYAEDRISETLATYAAKSAKPPRNDGVVLKSLTPGQFGIANIQHLTNGNFRLTVTNGDDVAEVFSYTVWHACSVVVTNWINEESNEVASTNTIWTPASAPFNGLESEWDFGTTNLVFTNGVGVWEDANVSSNARVRFYGVAKRADSDGDGLTDGAELFAYHLDPELADTDGDEVSDWDELMIHHTRPQDSDTDDDGVQDGEEIEQDLDPLVADTDHDGWRDGLDPDPKSRAWIDWGNEDVWTNGVLSVTNRYWPAWCVSATISAAGSNDYEASSFVSASNLAMYAGGGRISVNTNLVGGTNLVLKVWVSTEQAGQLYFQLRDAAWNNLINNILGSPYNPQYPSLIDPSALAANGGEITATVPMSAAPSASSIGHHRFTGAVVLYDSMLYMDANGDLLDDAQMASVTAHPTNDYDEDGLADYWEHEHGFDFTKSDQDGNEVLDGSDDFDDDDLSNAQESTHGTNPWESDTDEDGLSDYAEVETHGTNPFDPDTDKDGLPDVWEVQYQSCGLRPAAEGLEGRVGWWKLDEGEGNAAENAITNKYNGVLTGFNGTVTSGWTDAGRFGKAVQFDGLNDRILVQRDSAIITGASFSVSAHAYLDGDRMDGWPAIVNDWDQYSGSRGYGLWVSPSNTLYGMVGADVVESSPLRTNQWVWVAMECDGSCIRLYTNGVLAGSAASSCLAGTTNVNFAIGGNWDPNYAENWKGRIDEVRLFNGALGTNGLAALNDAYGDSDGDGLPNLQEYQVQSRPDAVDTDGDGLSDKNEVDLGCDPSVACGAPAAVWIQNPADGRRIP